MKLTTEQIDQLYAFTIKHYVEYYDLQTELVDHLANAIEQQWQENPKLSFEEALNIEFKKFGIFGFTEIIDKRKIEIQNLTEEMLKDELKPFLRLPRILGLLVLMGTLSWFCKPIILIAGTFIIIIFDFIFRFGKAILDIFKSSELSKTKKWFFLETIQKHSADTYAFWLFYLLNNFFFIYRKEWIQTHIPAYYVSLAYSIFFIYYLIYLYLFRVVIPFKYKQYLKETYPEYELSK